MLTADQNIPFFFRAPSGAQVTVVSLSNGAGPNQPAFRYAGQALPVGPVNVGQGQTQPGVTFSVQAGRQSLSAIAPFATNPPAGEFFFHERIMNGGSASLVLLGSVLPADPSIAWTIEGI